VTRALVALAILVGGCGATVDVYRYRPAPLPAGQSPQALLDGALRQLITVEWTTGHHPIPPGRLLVAPDATGIAGTLILPSGNAVPQLYVAYREFPSTVRSVSCFQNQWTVHLADRSGRSLDLVFPSRQSARQFLDAATALGHNQVVSR